MWIPGNHEREVDHPQWGVVDHTTKLADRAPNGRSAQTSGQRRRVVSVDEWSGQTSGQARSSRIRCRSAWDAISLTAWHSFDTHAETFRHMHPREDA